MTCYAHAVWKSCTLSCCTSSRIIKFAIRAKRSHSIYAYAFFTWPLFACNCFNVIRHYITLVFCSINMVGQTSLALWCWHLHFYFCHKIVLPDASMQDSLVIGLLYLKTVIDQSQHILTCRCLHVKRLNQLFRL